MSKTKAKTSKSRVSKATGSKLSERARRTTKAASPRSQNGARRGHAGSSTTVKFVAAKTGRVIKSSPVKPRLGKQRIHTIVRKWLSRGDLTTSEKLY